MCQLINKYKQFNLKKKKQKNFIFQDKIIIIKKNLPKSNLKKNKI